MLSAYSAAPALSLLTLSLCLLTGFTLSSSPSLVNVTLSTLSLVHFAASMVSLVMLTPNNQPVARLWLYIYLAATFVLRFVLSEWLFATTKPSAATRHMASDPQMLAAQIQAVLQYVQHILVVEFVAVRATNKIEKSLDRVHHVAWLVWINLGTFVGTLTALVAAVRCLRISDSLTVTNELLVYWHVLCVIVGGLGVALVVLVGRLGRFVKEMSFIVKVYWLLSDVEPLMDFSQEEEWSEDKEELV